MKLEFIFTKKEFIANCWYWTFHGENDPTLRRILSNQASTSTMAEVETMNT